MAHLSEMQKYKLSWMLENEFSKTHITKELGVDRSTVYRALNKRYTLDVFSPRHSTNTA